MKMRIVSKLLKEVDCVRNSVLEWKLLRPRRIVQKNRLVGFSRRMFKDNSFKKSRGPFFDENCWKELLRRRIAIWFSCQFHSHPYFWVRWFDHIETVYVYCAIKRTFLCSVWSKILYSFYIWKLHVVFSWKLGVIHREQVFLEEKQKSMNKPVKGKA